MLQGSANMVQLSYCLKWCTASLLLSTLPCAEAIPPPVSPVEDVNETSATIEKQDFATIYSVALAHVPTSVTAENFTASIVGNRLLKVAIAGTDIDWFFTLEEPISSDLTLIPPFEVKRLPGDLTGAVWEVYVVIPKHLRVEKEDTSAASHVPGQTPPASTEEQLVPPFPYAQMPSSPPQTQKKGPSPIRLPPTRQWARQQLTPADASLPELHPASTYDG